MHQPNRVHLQLICEVSHFLPEDTAAFLLKHLNSLLFSNFQELQRVQQKFHTLKIKKTFHQMKAKRYAEILIKKR
jgi:hypothetical protein